MRAANCFKNDNVIKTEGEMLRSPNFGRQSINETKEVLARMGLHLAMEVPGWPHADTVRAASLLLPRSKTHEGNDTRISA